MYTDSERTAYFIAQMLENSGIRVADIAKSTTLLPNCTIIDSGKTFSQTSKFISSYFACDLEKGDTGLYEIQWILDRGIEKRWKLWLHIFLYFSYLRSASLCGACGDLVKKRTNKGNTRSSRGASWFSKTKYSIITEYQKFPIFNIQFSMNGLSTNSSHLAEDCKMTHWESLLVLVNWTLVIIVILPLPPDLFRCRGSQSRVFDLFRGLSGAHYRVHRHPFRLLLL